MDTFNQLKNLPPHQKAIGVNSGMGGIHKRDEFLKTVDTNHWCGGVIPSDNEKLVVTDNGEPRFVVMPWREFEMMRLGARERICFAEVVKDALDVPIFALARRKFSELAVDTAKIRLEDLPV